MIIDGKQPLGHIVEMKTSNPLHYGNKPKAERAADDIAGSFADMLNGAISKVNNLQVEADSLNQKMISEPESVDMHTVMIASQKAEVSLTFTKAIRDEIVKTYRELMNLR